MTENRRRSSSVGGFLYPSVPLRLDPHFVGLLEAGIGLFRPRYAPTVGTGSTQAPTTGPPQTQLRPFALAW